MPICKREGFDLNQSQDAFHDNDLVFCCYITKRIFRDYDDYFRHVMAINSTVWQCEATGKDNLTYEEAVKSERLARKKMEQFKQSLRAPVLLVIEHARQSAVKTLTLMVSKFLRKRFFLNEEVTVTSKKNHVYKVVGIKPDEKAAKPVNGIYEDTEQLEYRLRASNGEEITASFDQLRRKRTEFNMDNLAMFIKNNVIRKEGILQPKPEVYKQYVKEPNISFSSIFIGKMPRYSPAKIKRPDAKDTKKQSTLNKFLVKGEEVPAKVKADKEAKTKALAEEMERVRLEKQAQLVEAMRLKAEMKAEKKAAMMLRIEEECSYLTTKTDDLERTDQYVLPKYHPIITHLPQHLLGDAFMIREFLHTYRGLLSSEGVLTQNLSFYEMSRAFTAREVAGPLSDILLVLLGTIFDFQKEEEEECPVSYTLGRVKQTEEPFVSMMNASHIPRYAKRHFSVNLNELPLDALTLSEVLRLHLLSSGAVLSERAKNWRIMYRNGYASREDPGLELLLQHTHIMHILKTHSIGHLEFVDIMRVINCLMAQILTYSASITVVEERMERVAKAKGELRAMIIAENRRLSAVEMTRRKITNEHHQQCMTDELKKDPEKKQALDNELNRRVADLLAQSDREQRKHETQMIQLHSELFNFLIYLGMDRCYRKYYVLESMPGIFIEHSPDSLDTCLAEPPLNKTPEEIRKQAQLPKSRKDLRLFLMKLYGDDTDKRRKNPGKQSLENKENQENLLNGHRQSAEPMEINGDEEEQTTPTQTELLMCTGDATNCFVHNEQHAERQMWTYIYQPEEIDELIRSLNPLGLRESELLDELTQLRALIEQHVKSCPIDMLSLDSNQKKNKFVSAMHSETHRKYGRSNFGLPENTELNEVMRLHLIDTILQLETDVYTGDLGRLKVKDMEKWRQQLLADEFDAQCKLQWGPGLMYSNEMTNDEDLESDDDKDDIDEEKEDALQYAKKFGSYRDPSQYLRKVKVPFEVNDTHQTQVRNLASALLQVEQAVERRFLKEPFGITAKKQEARPENHKLICEAKLQQWEMSLMQSTSFSQIFLHLNVFHDAILWKHSTNKSLCKVCRRGTDPEKMLLCDECNGGTHMFCMKPKMRKVPEGNWYCLTCVRSGGFSNDPVDKLREKKKRAAQKNRKFIVDEEDEDDADGDGAEQGEEEEDYDGDEADLSDTQDDKSEASSVPIKTNGKAASSRRRTSRRLKSKEIEETLDDNISESGNESTMQAENDDANSDDDEEEEVPTAKSHITVKANGRAAASRLRSNRGKKSKEMDEDESENSSIEDNDEEEDETEVEKVCQSCFYDGCEICCSRCSEWYHLECVKLKRQPREFICKKCKSNEKPKTRRRNSHVDGDAEDDEGRDEPQAKRSRNSLRISVGKAAANNNTTNNNNNNTSNHNNNRRSGRRTNDDLPLNSAVLYDLLELTMKHKAAWPFLRPVLTSEVPDYHKIIKTPMDLAKIKSKLNMGQYQINEEVLNDIQLVFKNCDLYNVEGNEIYDAGSELERFVMSCCKDLMLPFRPSDMNAHLIS